MNEKSVTIKLIGGLGNQLFQYAAAYAASKTYGLRLIIDVSCFEKYKSQPLSIMPLKIKFDGIVYRNSILNEFLLKVCKIIHLPCLPRVIENCGTAYQQFNIHDSHYILIGYFQSPKYFEIFKPELVKMFSLKEDFNGLDLELINLITSRVTLAIHVRRGDYLSSANSSVHGVCSIDYYDSAITVIVNNRTVELIVVFSDDIDWAKANIPGISNALFVNWNAYHPERDLCLMANCDHFVISNSTFSWWGAWLANSSDKMVVYPSPWYNDLNLTSNDLIPDGWIAMEK